MYQYIIVELTSNRGNYLIIRVNQKTGTSKYLSDIQGSDFQWKSNFFEARILSESQLKLIGYLFQ